MLALPLTLQILKKTVTNWAKIAAIAAAVSVVIAAIALIPGYLGVYKIDRTNSFDEQYENKYEWRAREFNRKVITPNIGTIRLATMDQFSTLIISEVEEQNIGDDLKSIAEFYEKVIECNNSWFCGVKNFKGEYSYRIRTFWYATRPYFFKIRGSTVPKHYAEKLEKAATKIWAKEKIK